LFKPAMTKLGKWALVVGPPPGGATPNRDRHVRVQCSM